MPSALRAFVPAAKTSIDNYCKFFLSVFTNGEGTKIDFGVSLRRWLSFLSCDARFWRFFYLFLFCFFLFGENLRYFRSAQVFPNPLSTARPRGTPGTRALKKNGFIYGVLQNHSLHICLKSQRPHLRPGMGSLPLA